MKKIKYYKLNIIKKIKKEYKKACKRYQNLFKAEKEKKAIIWSERYKNLSIDVKQKLVDYRKEYYRMRKNSLL